MPPPTASSAQPQDWTTAFRGRPVIKISFPFYNTARRADGDALPLCLLPPACHSRWSTWYYVKSSLASATVLYISTCYERKKVKGLPRFYFCGGAPLLPSYVKPINYCNSFLLASVYSAVSMNILIITQSNLEKSENIFSIFSSSVWCVSHYMRVPFSYRKYYYSMYI